MITGIFRTMCFNSRPTRAPWSSILCSQLFQLFSGAFFQASGSPVCYLTAARVQPFAAVPVSASRPRIACDFVSGTDGPRTMTMTMYLGQASKLSGDQKLDVDWADNLFYPLATFHRREPYDINPGDKRTMVPGRPISYMISFSLEPIDPYPPPPEVGFFHLPLNTGPVAMYFLSL